MLMNVHRGELGYFEWQRAIEAMINGCVLLSEHSLGFAPLIPGEHFLSVSFDSLDVALEGLLEDEPRLARMRRSAYELLRDVHPLSSSIAVLADAITDAARQPMGRAAHNGPPPVARSKSPQLPPPAWELTGMHGDSQAGPRSVAEVPVDDTDERETHVDARDLGAVQAGAQGVDRVERVGPAGGGAPRVTVVLSTSDQGESLQRAIRSVSLSEYVHFELLIVDDASSDDSAAQILATLSDLPWLVATILTRPRRGGLARSRNAACEHAAGELVLFMRACDSLYPHALGRLARALDEAPDAAFAYGMTAQIQADAPGDLSGYLGWDPGMLRYGNFVDSLAMVRRTALLEVGGFALDRSLSGWEELALWCAFADRGWRGTHVPEIVARRWAQHRSRPEDKDAATAWDLLCDRFAFLALSAAA